MRLTIAKLRACAQRATRHQGGAVALIFGLMLLPLFAAIGLAIDFGNIMTMRSKAQMAADAAALQASGVARDLIKASAGTEFEANAAIADAKARSKLLFDAHAKQAGLKDYTVTITVTRTGVNLTSTASFLVKSPNIISNVLGYKSFQAAGSAMSSASLPTYADVYMALDISQSMGIAASTAGMTKLYNSTSNMVDSKGIIQQFNQPIKCVFGCHTKEHVTQAPNHNKGYYWTETFAQVAKRVGVDLRIDVLRNATKDMLATAQKGSDDQPIYRFGLYTMGATAAKTAARLTELTPLSGNFTSLNAKADGIDMTDSIGSTAESYISENLAAFADKVGASGDGTEEAKAKKYAFIITDGLRNVTPINSSTCYTRAGRCVSTVTARSATGLNASCEALKKDKNVIVGVLYTTYMPITPIDKVAPQGDWYDIEVVKNIGDVTMIGRDLEKCASPGWFFQASEKKDIEAAMATMFEQTTLAPALTN